MNKVLIITYYWPPGGGAGVQRWLKFARYLPLNGWEPIILTVDPEFATYPVIDPTLEKDIPTGTRVFKTPSYDLFRLLAKDKSKIPSAGFASGADNSVKGKLLRFVRGNFFIPDPRRGWNRFAFRKACELIRNDAIDVIITTSPPHSSQLIGLRLKRKFPAIKWIVDLRDPWTDIYYYNRFYQLLPSRATDACYEKSVLQSADTVITIGRSLKELFDKKVPGIANKTVVVHNGFDPEDFKGISSPRPDILTISYIGTLSDAYPVTGLLEALKIFTERGRDFRLRFVGTVTDRQASFIRTSLGAERTEFNQYVSHKEAVQYMLSSSILLLIIPDHPGNKCIITGKLFEYLSAGKPVLCLGPTDGDAAEILRETGHGATFLYNDDVNICRYLEEASGCKELRGIVPSETYSKKNLTGKLVSIL